MCGACGPREQDPRVVGPRQRALVAETVERVSGLRTRVAIGQWTVATPTGRQLVCATLDALVETPVALCGRPRAVVAEAVAGCVPGPAQPAGTTPSATSASCATR
jgi:hypothetical protein